MFEVFFFSRVSVGFHGASCFLWVAMAGSEALGRLLRHSGDYGALNLGGVRLHAVGMFFNGEE